jgi:hypothetical protein
MAAGMAAGGAADTAGTAAVIGTIDPTHDNLPRIYFQCICRRASMPATARFGLRLIFLLPGAPKLPWAVYDRRAMLMLS